MPRGFTPPAALEARRRSAPSTRCVIVITIFADQTPHALLEAGAQHRRHGIVVAMRTRRGKGDTATITTVAAKANVAPMTVSRVINGGYASPAVRARVERVIKEMGYAPSSTARSLRYGRKGCIGVAVESIHDAWFMGLLGGIEEELAKSHVGLMLGSWKPGEGPYDSRTIAAWIDERRVDGFIMVRSTKRELPLLEAAAAAGVPVTLICPDQAADVGFTVRCRNFDAGKALGDALACSGTPPAELRRRPEGFDRLDRSPARPARGRGQRQRRHACARRTCPFRARTCQQRARRPPWNTSSAPRPSVRARSCSATTAWPSCSSVRCCAPVFASRKTCR